MTLHVVSEDYQPRTSVGAVLPLFEGEEVHELRARMVSASNLELGETPHRLDQTTRMLVVGRVTRIDHVVDDKTGQVTRMETFKVVDALEVPWEAVSEYFGADE